MMDNYAKKSLLGQLEQSGILSNGQNAPEVLPFGMLTGNMTEPSPFIENPIENKTKQNTNIVQKRLNDLDLNIFQEGNFINIADEELTSNEKIKKIKSLIKKTDKKIYMLEDSDDKILKEKLLNEKEALTETLNLLEEGLQNPNSIIFRENQNLRELAKKIKIEEKIKKMENFIFKFCPILYKSFLVRHALNKLVMLNENTKELMQKKIPYGESEIRYNDFIAYLSCANVIHAKLTKKM